MPFGGTVTRMPIDHQASTAGRLPKNRESTFEKLPREPVMILKSGDKVLIVHRRLFEQDLGRFFLGTIKEYEGGVASVTGYTIVRESEDGLFLRKDDLRTKIVSMASGTFIVYQLSDDFAVEQARIQARDNRLMLLDGRGFEMNLSEHGY
jgi:hypothetical protein